MYMWLISESYKELHESQTVHISKTSLFSVISIITIECLILLIFLKVCVQSKYFYLEIDVREDLLEKEMATHSGILAWKILWAEESGGLESMVLQRVGQDLVAKPPPQLLYNVALASAVQQSESVILIHICRSTLFKILFPYRSLQSIEQSSL